MTSLWKLLGLSLSQFRIIKRLYTMIPSPTLKQVPGEDLHVLWVGYRAVSASQGCLRHLGNLVQEQQVCGTPGLIPLPTAGYREYQQQTQSSWPRASHLEGASWMM